MTASWITHFSDRFQHWMIEAGASTVLAAQLYEITALLLSLLGLLILDRILVGLGSRALHNLVARTRVQWDDVLSRNRVFVSFIRLIPAAIFLYVIEIQVQKLATLKAFLTTLTSLYILFLVVFALNKLLLSGNEIYTLTRKTGSRYSIKAFTQVLQLIVLVVGAIVALSILISKDITVILAGLSAFAAVLILVFRDSILGFVGGVQITLNNMLNYGDWITAPDFDADGTVVDISLTTVKVQNWDKTITTIPTYSLVSGSFQNWRGMEDSGGRRIKRAILIDMNSIHFCSDELLQGLEKVDLISDYIRNKEQDIDKFNSEHKLANSLLNGRQQTNIGAFRAYVVAYLRTNPDIHKGMTFMVRQLAPTDKGLPLEIYVFSKIQEWTDYEALQSDIFDHLLAVLPQFELRVFQSPSGADFSMLAHEQTRV